MTTEAEKRLIRAQIKGLVPSIRLAMQRRIDCSSKVGDALNALRLKIIADEFSGDDRHFILEATPEIEINQYGRVCHNEAMRLVCQLAEMADLSCDRFFTDVLEEGTEDDN